MDKYGDPFGFQQVDLAGFPKGYPLMLDNHIPRSRLSQMLQYISDGEYIDHQITSKVTMQAVVYNPDTRNFGYTKATLNWGGDGIIKLSVWSIGLPAVDYSAYITTRQYGKFLPDWAVVVLAVVYVLLTVSDIIRSSFSQAKIRDDHAAPAAIQLTTGGASCCCTSLCPISLCSKSLP